MSEDTKLTELIINTLSPEQFEPITPSETEIYLVEDDAEYATVEELANKQDIINDLDTIRDGASKGATALQSVPGTYALKTYVDNHHDATKQNTLVSGTNIKTINNESILGEGDIEIKTGYHPDIFTCKWSDHIINDIQWLRADTFSWQDGNVYATAYNKLVEEYATGVTERDGDIQFKRTSNGFKIADRMFEQTILNKYDTDGIAWYYILDTDNKRFKLPRTKWGFKGLRGNAADGIQESLPNISCSLTNEGIGFKSAQVSSNGCLVVGSSLSSTISTGSATAYNVSIDASAQSSTYQDNAPVQERGTQMYLYFYVGEYAREAIEQTAGITSEQLNSKVDISSLAECHVVTEFFENGSSGHMIWSNGYSEQWGPLPTSSAWTNVTITFVKKFKNTDYIVFPSIGHTTHTDANVIVSKADNSFTCTGYNSTGCSNWIARGYLADGEY